jgi:hypothetical protein
MSTPADVGQVLPFPVLKPQLLGIEGQIHSFFAHGPPLGTMSATQPPPPPPPKKSSRHVASMLALAGGPHHLRGERGHRERTTYQWHEGRGAEGGFFGSDNGNHSQVTLSGQNQPWG